MDTKMEKDIGVIGNYYGGLLVREASPGVYEWGIENYDGIGWDQIPKYLYDALVKYEDERTALKDSPHGK